MWRSHAPQVGDGTWFQARETCEAAGARLCALRDLTAGLGWGTGCHGNADFLWTSTPCADGADSYGWYYQVTRKAAGGEENAQGRGPLKPKKAAVTLLANWSTLRRRWLCR